MNDSPKSLERIAPVISLDDTWLRKHIAEIVGESVEETLNRLLCAGADELCKAQYTSALRLGSVPAQAIT